MNFLIACVAFQIPYASCEALWADVERAYASFPKMSYNAKLVDIDSKGKSTEIESGSFSYVRGGEISITYRDNVVGVNASMSRNRKGEWDQGASDDANSSSPANNALGYCDSIPSRWPYKPISLLEKEGLDRPLTWSTSAPKDVVFRGTACFLVDAVEATDRRVPVQIWIEKKRKTLLRVLYPGKGRSQTIVFRNIQP